MSMRTTKTSLRRMVANMADYTGIPYDLDKHAGGYQLQVKGQPISPRYNASHMEAFLFGMRAVP